MTQLTAQLDVVVSSANEASDLMENEQMEKREIEEKLNEANVSASKRKINPLLLGTYVAVIG